VLILEGETSDNKSFIDVKKATAAIPRASHRVVADAGHLIPMERPRETAEALLEFFASRSAGSSRSGS